MYIFCLIMLSFFAVIGLASFVTSLIRSRVGSDIDLAVILYGLRATDAEARARKAAVICEEIRCKKLICECTDDEAAEICRKLQRTHGIIEIRPK